MGLFHQAEHVAQMVMLAVPHQNPLITAVPPVCPVCPVVRRLIPVKGIHTVMAVNIGEEEVDPLFREHIPHPQGNTVHIRIHRAVHLNIPAGEDLHHFPGASVENIDIHQVGKVQIRGGNTDVPPLHACKEVIPFILAAFRQKPLHAEIGFTVPLEIPFRRIAFIAFQDDRHRTANEINLGVNDLFLQIGVADIRVGMVDNADVPGVFHDASFLFGLVNFDSFRADFQANFQVPNFNR